MQRTAVLVEDNLMFGMMVEPALRKLGYAVRTVAGGADLVGQVTTAGPEVVLVNLTSTRFDGPELVRALKSRPELAGVGLVGYAGHVERHFFQAGKEAGADLVVPNSAMRKALPEVLDKLRQRLETGGGEEWPQEADEPQAS